MAADDARTLGRRSTTPDADARILAEARGALGVDADVGPGGPGPAEDAGDNADAPGGGRPRGRGRRRDRGEAPPEDETTADAAPGDDPTRVGAPGAEETGPDGGGPGDWVPVAAAGKVVVEGPETVDAPRPSDIEDLRPRDRRRRRRRARRDGRYLFRGRLFPRTLRALAAIAVAMGLAAGAAAAATYAVMDARVARADKAAAPAPEPTTPAGGTVQPGPAGDPALSEIIIDANATGADATIEGFAVAVSDDGDRTYWLTAYDLVAASTVVPPSPVTLRSTGGAVEVWTWDESSGLGLIATGDVEATPRTWIPAETTITSGSLLTVSLPTDGPPLPVTVTVEEPLTGPEDSFTVRVDGTVLPLGAGLTAPDGRLVGILTAADYTGGNTVATVTSIRSACSVVLDCTDVGG